MNDPYLQILPARFGTSERCVPGSDGPLRVRPGPTGIWRIGLGRIGLGHVRLGRSVTVASHPATMIAGETDIGALYGTFRFLRLLQTRQSLDLQSAVAVSTGRGSATIGRPDTGSGTPEIAP